MIIIPSYDKLKDGWICYYDESRGDIHLRRFLNPKGWSSRAHYWPDSRLLERHFQTWNQIPLPIEDWEYEQEVKCREYYEQMQEEDFHRMVDEHFAREDARRQELEDARRQELEDARRQEQFENYWASTLSDMRKHMS